MSIRCAIHEIQEKHLLQLKDDQAYEEQTLEFKSDVNFKEEEAVAEFLRDISAMANADGGNVVIGMSEDDQGRAKDLSATKYSDLESFESRIRQFCENHIDPPLVSLRFQPVELTAGGHAVVLRIEQGWAGPHMVTYKDEFRFFVRRGRSKEKMNIDEIRRRFLLSDTAIRRMKSFREQRIRLFEDVLQSPGAAARPLIVLLHLFPLSAFAKRSAIDLSILWRDQLLLSFPDGIPHFVRYNFDGIEARFEMRDGQCPRRVQVFRDGCIELADAITGDRFVPYNNIKVGAIESLTVRFVREFLTVCRHLRVDPPIFIALSLLQTKGYQLDVPQGEGNPDARPIDRSKLVFPDVSLEDLHQSPEATMRPTFNIFWQSFGYENCRLYDQEGKLVIPRPE